MLRLIAKSMFRFERELKRNIAQMPIVNKYTKFSLQIYRRNNSQIYFVHVIAT